MTEIIKSRLIRIPQYTSTSISSGHSNGPVYPNRHSGRVFTNLLPNQQGISLPIRGEKILKTTDELAQQAANQQVSPEQLVQQAEQLKQYVGNLKNNKEVKQILELNQQTIPVTFAEVQQSTVQPPTPTPEVMNNIPPSQTIDTSKSPNQAPTEIMPAAMNNVPPKNVFQMDVAKPAPEQVQTPQQQVPIKEPQLQTAPEVVETPVIKEKKPGLFSRLFKRKPKETYVPLDDAPEAPEIKQNKEEKPKPVQTPAPTVQPQIKPLEKIMDVVRIGPKFANTEPLTATPNCISGIVYDKEGKIVPGMVVVIKNNMGEPVRAIKTNPLGQFVTTTPLTNDVYTITVNPTSEANLEFDTVEITLEGKGLRTLEFKSR